jgi:hypothetical protein
MGYEIEKRGRQRRKWTLVGISHQLARQAAQERTELVIPNPSTSLGPGSTSWSEESAMRPFVKRCVQEVPRELSATPRACLSTAERERGRHPMSPGWRVVHVPRSRPQRASGGTANRGQPVGKPDWSEPPGARREAQWDEKGGRRRQQREDAQVVVDQSAMRCSMANRIVNIRSSRVGAAFFRAWPKAHRFLSRDAQRRSVTDSLSNRGVRCARMPSSLSHRHISRQAGGKSTRASLLLYAALRSSSMSRGVAGS